MSRYDVGDTIRIRATFTDLDGDNADPTSIALTIKPVNGDTVAKIKSDLTNTDVGVYYYDYAIVDEGRHTYRIAASGGVDAAIEGSFDVRESLV